MSFRPVLAADCGCVRSLSSRFCLLARAVPFNPAEPDDCSKRTKVLRSYPLLHRPCWLDLIREAGRSDWRNEANMGSLALRLAPSPPRGFADRIAPTPRPRSYMANGSFQGKLLSVYETKQVSLTHRMNANSDFRFQISDLRMQLVICVADAFHACPIGFE